jgi:hypothetical protein
MTVYFFVPEGPWAWGCLASVLESTPESLEFAQPSRLLPCPPLRLGAKLEGQGHINSVLSSLNSVLSPLSLLSIIFPSGESWL